MESGRLSVRRTLKRPKGGGWHFDRTKTPQSRRSLEIPAGLVELLQRHEVEQQPNEYNLVFAGLNGEPLHENNISGRNYKSTLKRAGLPKTFRLYDLRHTCATLLLLAGVHPKVVAERLGHSSIRETMDTYSHVLPNMQKQASDALGAMLFEKLQQEEES